MSDLMTKLRMERGSGLVDVNQTMRAAANEIENLRAAIARLQQDFDTLFEDNAEKQDEIARLCEALATAEAERDALFNSAWALLNDEPQANGEYVHAVTCSADRKKPIGCGGCSCQLGRRIKLLASALAETRRVLRLAEWDTNGLCPTCRMALPDGHTQHCALATALAEPQEPTR